MNRLAFALLIGAILAGCTDPEPIPPSPAIEPSGVAANETAGDAALGEEKIIQVDTAEEFIQAIGSDRIIEFTADEYILSDVPDRYMEHVRWDPTTAGNTVTIRGVRNLTLRAAGPEPVRLIVRPYSVFVLNFDGVENVTLEGLILGHAPEKGGCESGVVGATNSRNLTFRHCDLFGCGTEGLTLENVQGLNFEESIIRECTYGIMTVQGCKDLRFSRSEFRGNEQFWGVQFHDTRDVVFTECRFISNQTVEPLFSAVSCSAITIAGCSFEGNRVPAMTNRSAAITIE